MEVSHTDPERPAWQVRISPARTAPGGDIAEGDPAGGGVWVGGRWVLTCAHVLNPPPPVLIDFTFAEGPAIPATIVDWIPDEDLTLLELADPPPPQARPAPLRSGRGVIGHPCLTFGYPRGYEDGVWSRLTIAGLTGGSLFQVTSRIAHDHPIE
jgi:hypothetical protein